MSGWAGDGFLDSIPTVHSLSLTVTHCHSLTQPPSQCHPQIVPTPAAHGQVSAHHPPTHSQWPAATLSLLSLSVTDRQSVSQSVSQSKAVTSDQQQDDNATTQHHTTTFMMTTMTIRRRHHYFLRSCCAVLCCVVLCCVLCCGMLDCVESFTHSLGVVWCCRMCCCFRFRIPFVQSERHCYRHGRKGAAWLRVGGVSVVLD